MVEAALKDAFFKHGYLLETLPKVCRIEIPVDRCCLLDFLSRQTVLHRLYWADRSATFEVAGLGVCLSFDDADLRHSGDSFFSDWQAQCMAHPRLRLYGGGDIFSRHYQAEAMWESFPQLRYVLPRFEYYCGEDGAYFALNVSLAKDDDLNEVWGTISGELSLLCFDASEIDRSFPSVATLSYTPDMAQWANGVDAAKDAIASGRLNKVVMGRLCQVELSDAIDAYQLLRQARDMGQVGFVFAFQFGTSAVYAGISPESLYSRNGQQIESEAVAGTRPRGDNDAIDKALAKELLDDRKEALEHDLVHRHIVNALSPLCKTFESDEMEILALLTVQHLKHRYRGVLKDGVSDMVLLRALHPTPAVCGLPVGQAQCFLADNELINRGWYTGLVGWIGVDAAQFTVAIRSGVIDTKQMSLFSGAGIMAESFAEKEWVELDHKVSMVFRVLAS